MEIHKNHFIFTLRMRRAQGILFLSHMSDLTEPITNINMVVALTAGPCTIAFPSELTRKIVKVISTVGFLRKVYSYVFAVYKTVRLFRFNVKHCLRTVYLKKQIIDR